MQNKTTIRVSIINIIFVIIAEKRRKQITKHIIVIHNSASNDSTKSYNNHDNNETYNQSKTNETNLKYSSNGNSNNSHNDIRTATMRNKTRRKRWTLCV